MKTATYLATLGLTWFLAACSTVPETGRQRVILVSEVEEQQLGVAAFADVKAREKISSNQRWNEQVQRVGARLAGAIGREMPNAEWEFVVFESDQINAFALPGGKVSVYTGLLKLVSSDDELAIVLGHELAHVTSRHGAERITQTKLVSGASSLAAAFLEVRDTDPGKRALWLGVLGMGTQYGVLLPYSRIHETESDTIGLRFAAQAGYDPRAALTFWKKMSAASGKQGKLAALLSDHPSDEARIENLEKLIPQYLPTYESAKKH